MQHRRIVQLPIIVLFTISTGMAQHYTCERDAFDIRVQGGMAHIIWRGLGEVDAINCPPPPNSQVFLKGIDFPQFKCLYNVPWTIGGQVGYSYNDSIRLFLECNYLQACPKNSAETRFLVLPGSGAPAGTLLNFRIGRYRLYDVALGTQYYFRWCQHIVPFFGIKVGLTEHMCNRFSLDETIPGFGLLILIPQSTPALLFKRKTSPTAGIQFGFDVYLGEHLNFALTGEIVGTCGPKTNSNIMPMPNFPIPTTNILIGHVDTEIRIPITASLRYSF